VSLILGVSTILDFLLKKGFYHRQDPNSKLSQEMYTLLMKDLPLKNTFKEEAQKIGCILFSMKPSHRRQKADIKG